MKAEKQAQPVAQRERMAERQPDGIVQQQVDASPRQQAQQAKLAQLQANPDANGLPPTLRGGIESLSGMDMGDVRVHRNSSRPAQMQAHAFAQGSNIFLGPGQEQHLPHEAWHVVQQKQGRVKANAEVGGVAINNDQHLESEADNQGARALQMKARAPALRQVAGSAMAVLQRHLFVDTPEDFRHLEDLGMWWVMACEWKEQKTVRGDKVSKDPKDYISSLSNVAGAKGKIDKDEHIKMVAHGTDPDKGATFEVGGDKSVKAIDKQKEIEDVYKETGGKLGVDNKFSPLYCFGAHSDGIMDKKMGKGPLLMPSGNIHTVDMAAGVDKTKWKGGKFIDAAGSWKKATAALDDLPKLGLYKKAKAHDGTLLAAALEEVLTEIDAEYNDFVKATTSTGSMANPWGV